MQLKQGDNGQPAENEHPEPGGEGVELKDEQLGADRRTALTQMIAELLAQGDTLSVVTARELILREIPRADRKPLSEIDVRPAE